MFVVAGRRVFSPFCCGRLRKLSTRAKNLKFSTAANNNLKNEQKAGVPASEPGKISAALLKKFSEPLVIENIEAPKKIETNEVLINVDYCALNASDALLSKNLYTFEPTLPMVLGYEIVGKLVQVGAEAEQKGFKTGDKVIALNKERYGGLAQQCIAEVTDVWRVPSGIKSADAVALLDGYVTALLALEKTATMQVDDIILVNVGISSIGLAAADLATNVFKTKVISVCASEEGAALARDKGVLASFKYKELKLFKEIEAVAAEKNTKGIFDDASGEHLKKELGCFMDIYKSDATIKNILRDDNFAVVVHHLGREARLIVAGAAAVTKNIESTDEKGGFSVTGFNLREFRKKDPETYRIAGDDILQFFEEGLIKPTSVLTVELPEVNEALEFVLNSKSPGKVIVNLKDS